MKRMMLLLLMLSPLADADTMDHFMNIAGNIPKMEMKADPQSQAWSRSARNILTLTCESIAESLLLANEKAAANGAPLFCIPNGVTINASKLNGLIEQTYRGLSSPQQDKNKMTVSQIALMGLVKQYPCNQSSQVSSSVMRPKAEAEDNASPFGLSAGNMQHQDSLNG